MSACVANDVRYSQLSVVVSSAGAVFNYFLLLLAIVREKEHRLRTAMLTMGLSRGSSWCSWLIYSMVINTLSSVSS